MKSSSQTLARDHDQHPKSEKASLEGSSSSPSPSPSPSSPSITSLCGTDGIEKKSSLPSNPGTACVLSCSSPLQSKSHGPHSDGDESFAFAGGRMSAPGSNIGNVDNNANSNNRRTIPNSELTKEEREHKKELKRKLKLQMHMNKLHKRIRHAVSRRDFTVQQKANEELQQLLARQKLTMEGKDVDAEEERVLPRREKKGKPNGHDGTALAGRGGNWNCGKTKSCDADISGNAIDEKCDVPALSSAAVAPEVTTSPSSLLVSVDSNSESKSSDRHYEAPAPAPAPATTVPISNKQEMMMAMTKKTILSICNQLFDRANSNHKHSQSNNRILDQQRIARRNGDDSSHCKNNDENDDDTPAESIKETTNTNATIPSSRKGVQTQRAVQLLKHMTRGTQHQQMFLHDSDTLWGYARQKFHERAMLLCLSLCKLDPRTMSEKESFFLLSSSSPSSPLMKSSLSYTLSEMDVKWKEQQQTLRREAWDQLRNVETICSVGCGPGSDAAGMAAFVIAASSASASCSNVSCCCGEKSMLRRPTDNQDVNMAKNNDDDNGNDDDDDDDDDDDKNESNCRSRSSTGDRTRCSNQGQEMTSVSTRMNRGRRRRRWCKNKLDRMILLDYAIGANGWDVILNPLQSILRPSYVNQIDTSYCDVTAHDGLFCKEKNGEAFKLLTMPSSSSCSLTAAFACPKDEDSDDNVDDVEECLKRNNENEKGGGAEERPGEEGVLNSEGGGGENGPKGLNHLCSLHHDDNISNNTNGGTKIGTNNNSPASAHEQVPPLQCDMFLISYLLTETRGKWEQFIVDLFRLSKHGTLFYFAEPTPWQLHHLIDVIVDVGTDGEISDGVIRFVWLDSSMDNPELQVLDGRVGPAVLLAIKKRA